MDRRAIFPKGFAGYYLQISISVVLIFSQRFAVLWKHRLLEFSYFAHVVLLYLVISYYACLKTITALY